MFIISILIYNSCSAVPRKIRHISFEKKNTVKIIMKFTEDIFQTSNKSYPAVVSKYLIFR